MTGTWLDLTRRQVLAFRRQAGELGERLPAGRESPRETFTQFVRRFATETLIKLLNAEGVTQ